jgi:hypothetical protein
MLPGGLTQENDLAVGPAVTILWHVMVTALFSSFLPTSHL